MRTLRDFGSYLLALWGEWRALVMGGSIFAVIAIVGVATHDPLPLNVGYAVLGATFIWAGFLAWRKESQEKIQLQAHTGNRKSVPGRIFVNESPAYLTQFYKDHISIRALKLVEPYIGKWMTLVDVVVGDIAIYSLDEYRVSGKTQDGEMAFMYFGKEWAEQISILRQTSKITVTGKIGSLDGYVKLDNCEIQPSTHF